MRKLSSPGTPQNTAAPAPAQQTQAAPAQAAPAQGVKGWGNAAPRAAAPQPAAAQPAGQPAPAAAPVKGWGNTAFATKPAPQPAPVEQAPPEAQQFAQEADAQFGDATQGLLPEGALHPSQTIDPGGINEPPFDGGQPTLLDAPPAQAKTRAPRASRSANKEAQSAEIGGEAAQRVLRDAQTFANRNVNYSVDVSAMLKAMLEVGTPLETALEAIANLTDHMDGKE